MNFLVQNECMFLKFFPFTFMKIELNCIVLLAHLNTCSVDLQGWIYEMTLQKMSFTAMQRYDAKH